jgi:membrane-associated phospholipid phosphatase
MLTVPRAATLLAGLTAYCFLFYGLTNYFPTGAPSSLPFFPIESRIPVIPASVWVYLSYYPLLALAGMRMAKQPWIWRAVGATAFVITCSGIVFLIHPTMIERPAFAGGGFSGSALRWVRAIDPPNNCFPSLHVGLATCCGLIWRKAAPRRGPLLLLWTASIAVSTLTTKQHYLIDVLGGLLVAAIAWVLFFVLPLGRRAPLGRARSREEAGD